jgi:hypothetical protein
MSIKSRETLEKWQKAKEFALRVYRFDSLEQDGEKLTQLINGYVSYLKRSKQGRIEPGANHSVRDDTVLYEVELPKFLQDE